MYPYPGNYGFAYYIVCAIMYPYPGNYDYAYYIV